MSIRFRFKQEIEDFIVEEELLEQPCGSGDFHYFFIEKKQTNTMEVISRLLQHFPLKREALGITGLKDKQGITRQRISISQKHLKKIWWKSQFCYFLQDFVSIVKEDQHHSPLAVGKNRGNRFQIRLRSQKALTIQEQQALEQTMLTLQAEGFPNAFGIQRFGKGNKNFKKASRIFEEEITWGSSYEIRFKLQAYGNMRFNEYVMQRWEQMAFLLDGDVMVNKYHAFGAEVATYEHGKLHHFDYWRCKEEQAQALFLTPDHKSFISDYSPERWFATGPVLGWNQILCPLGSKAREWDEFLLKQSQFTQHFWPQICKRYQLYGFRRALWVRPYHFSWKWEWDDLLLSFGLPTGAYASILLAHLLRNIDPQWCSSNGLIIPRVHPQLE